MCPARENVAFFPGCLGAMLVHQDASRTPRPYRAARAGARRAATSRSSGPGHVQRGRPASSFASSSGPLRRRSASTGPGNSVRASRSRSSSTIRPACAVGCAKRRLTRVGGTSRCRSAMSIDVHPATPEPEERAQLIHQRLGNPAKALRVGDLGLEVAPHRAALPRHEGGTRIGCASDGAIERMHHPRREPAGESVARQLQAIADGAHAHRSERFQALFRPARTGERRRARRLASPSLLRRATCSPTCENQSEASVVGASASCGSTPMDCSRSRTCTMKRRTPPNSLETAAHLEQHRVGQLEHDPRRESDCAGLPRPRATHVRPVRRAPARADPAATQGPS